eukprot:5471048-Pyramimonas_sp.AAC.1
MERRFRLRFLETLEVCGASLTHLPFPLRRFSPRFQDELRCRPRAAHSSWHQACWGTGELHGGPWHHLEEEKPVA